MNRIHTSALRVSTASEPAERPSSAPQALPRVHRSFSEGGSEPAQRRASDKT